jgi:PAS domain S-box-containing protein
MIENTRLQELSLHSLINIFSTISYFSEDVYWIGVSDFKSCLFVNTAYEKIWGCPRESILKDIRSWDNYLHPQDLKNYHPLLEMVKKRKQEGPRARFKEKYRIITQQGEIKHIEDYGQPIYNKNGQYIGNCGVAKDVTSKKIVFPYQRYLLNSFPKNKQTRFYLKGRYKNIYLTCREAECAFYLLKGKTSKEIAKTLNISYRTVEDILQKIKNKLNINYRSELCQILIDNYFLHQ